MSRVRALTILAGLLAGIGVLAYAAAWMVLPVEGEADESPPIVRALASLALAGAALAGLLTLAALSGAATLFGFGWAVLACGVIFLLGAVLAWPLLRPVWVLLPMIAAFVPAVAIATSGMHIAPQAGVLAVAPAVPGDIPAGGYETGLGDLLVDLRGFEASPGSDIPLRLTTGTGRTVVAVPRNRCFNLDVRYRLSQAGPLLSRPFGGNAGTATFYGQSQPAQEGHYIRISNVRDAPTLRITFSSKGGSLWLRDYPSFVGPLYQPAWPDTLELPPTPGEINWDWDVSNRSKANLKRWRAWRARAAATRHQIAVLTRGACARSTTATIAP